MNRFTRALIYGVIAAVSGVVLSLLPGLIALEEAVGLKILFKLRGSMPPPPSAVIISLDRESARKLSLPIDSRKWPRSTHAKLVEALHKMQAKVIVFDMLFSEPQSDHEDEAFSKSINMAGNVVLCEFLEKESFTIDQKDNKSIERINIERVIPPVSPLAESAVALAPFPLPKIPVQLSRYWTFKGSAENLPTLPVIAINVFTLNAYDDLAKLIKKQIPEQFNQLLPEKNTILENRELVNNVIALRTLFKTNPSISIELIQSVNTSDQLYSSPKVKQDLSTLIRLFGGDQTPFLNYYGPPGTIVTIPYHQILHPSKGSFPGDPEIEVRGKAVFIGMSETLHTGQKDGFHTVFSQPDGIDLSGVEVAATAFSNLLSFFWMERATWASILANVLLDSLSFSTIILKIAGKKLIFDIIYKRSFLLTTTISKWGIHVKSGACLFHLPWKIDFSFDICKMGS
jgi:adenylate cyclase